MNINNLKIGHRLGISYGALLVLMLALTLIGINSMSQIEQRLP